MKKSRHSVFWFVALFLLAATGCVQPVTIEPPAEREVFVRCILEKGNYIQQVTLLYSGGVGEYRFEPVVDAEVTISGPEAKDRIYQFDYTNDGIYKGRLEPEAGKTYVLKVFIPGRDTIVATTMVPRSFSIGAGIAPPIEWLEEGGHNQRDMNPWAFYIWGDAYDQMKKRGGKSLLSEMPGMFFWISAEERHHLYILGRMEDSSGVVGPITQLATNHRLVDNVNENGRRYIASSDAENQTATHQQRYNRLIKQHYENEGLVYHNNYLRIDCPQNYDNGLRSIYRLLFPPGTGVDPGDFFDVEMDATQYFTVVGEFDYNIWDTNHSGETHPVLYFCSVSEEYDRYLKSVQATLADAEGDLLSTLYGVAGGYSNVRGGQGVFGAINTLRHDCDVKITYSFGLPRGYYAGYPACPALLPSL